LPTSDDDKVRGISFKSNRKPAMHRVVQITLLLTLGLVSSRGAPPVQQPSASPAQATPIPIINVAREAQSTETSLQEADASVSKAMSSTDDVTASLSNLISEIDPRMAEDTRLLGTSPSLDVLYRIKLTWQDLGENLSVFARELTENAKSLEEELARLDQLGRAWQATLQSAKEHDTPLPVLQSLQGIVGSVEKSQRAAQSAHAQVLTMLGRVSEEETRVQKTLFSVDRSRIGALKGLLVRDGPPIWNFGTGFGREWGEQTGESFSSQMKASAAFTKRLPFAFLIHAALIVLIATALQWMRRGVEKLAKEKPELQRALPILDLPVSTAFVLSVLISPVIYPQAPRLIQAILATLALISTVLILRRLLDRNSSPILNALVIIGVLKESFRHSD
jgi:hypothetical protein